jgi:hypothetical protein
MPSRTIPPFVSGLAILVALLAGLSATVSSHAQEPMAQLGIKPVGMDGSYFTLSMAAGESREVTVELGNFGASKARARTYPADVYTIVNGGFGATLDGEPTSGVTRWLDYPADTLELEPRTGVNRTFKVTVPADTRPGEYITSLAIQNSDADAGTSGGSIALRQTVRHVIAVAITVPGPRMPGLEIGAVTYRTVTGKSLIAVAVKNTGNIHLKPSGEFVLRDANAAEVSRYPIVMDTVYAGTATFIEVPFGGRLNPGDYTIALALADSKQHAQVAVQAAPLIVPPLETDGVPAAIGVVPQPAAINPSPSAPADQGPQLSRILAGGCLVIAVALLGVYGYRRKRRKQARIAA